MSNMSRERKVTTKKPRPVKSKKPQRKNPTVKAKQPTKGAAEALSGRGAQLKKQMDDLGI